MCRILDYIIICISTSTEPPISVPTWVLRYSLRVGISTYLIFNQFSWYIAFSSRWTHISSLWDTSLRRLTSIVETLLPYLGSYPLPPDPLLVWFGSQRLRVVPAIREVFPTGHPVLGQLTSSFGLCYNMSPYWIDYIFNCNILLPNITMPLVSDFHPTFRPLGAYSLRVSVSTYLIFNPPRINSILIFLSMQMSSFP